MKPQFTYKAQVVRVVDADTIDFTIELGFYMTAKVRVRVRGVNAPEMSTQAGKDAAKFVQQLLPVGISTVLTTYPQDKYGRWLGDIQTTQGDLATVLLAGQMAIPFMV